MADYIRDKIAFTKTVRGFVFTATYLVEPKGDALIEISKDGTMLRSVLWPAYKIWNIAAHAWDIADDLEDGLVLAGSDCLGGTCYTPAPQEGG
jgi:hypothetical protein